MIRFLSVESPGHTWARQLPLKNKKDKIEKSFKVRVNMLIVKQTFSLLTAQQSDVTNNAPLYDPIKCNIPELSLVSKTKYYSPH